MIIVKVRRAGIGDEQILAAPKGLFDFGDASYQPAPAMKPSKSWNAVHLARSTLVIRMILRKRSARDGETKPIMPDGNRSDALSAAALIKQFAGLHKNRLPQQRPCAPAGPAAFFAQLLPNPDAPVGPSPCRSQDDMLQGETRAPQWTLWFGCGALALESMRLRSARTRLTKRFFPA